MQNARDYTQLDMVQGVLSGLKLDEGWKNSRISRTTQHIDTRYVPFPVPTVATDRG